MTMYRETIRQSIAEIVEPLLQTQGFELVELQLQQRKGQWLIRVFADVEGGISLEDCQRLSRDIGLAFDVEDLIATSYVLEVSSPGLDRRLRTARDFQRQRQRMVTVFLNSPHMGQAQQTGRVAAVTASHLVLHLPPAIPLTIPLPQIDYGVVELEFK
jgi:ribosome maturation factor RimP